MDEAIEILKQQGAIIVDPADIPSIVATDPDREFPAGGTPAPARPIRKGKDDGLLRRAQVRHEARLQQVAGVARTCGAGRKSLTELREWNITHTKAGAIKYGQSNLDISDEMDVEADRRATKPIARRISHLGATMASMKHESRSESRRAAVSGLERSGDRREARLSDRDRAVRDGAERSGTPHFRRRFTPKPAPFGVSFTGMACSRT